MANYIRLLLALFIAVLGAFSLTACPGKLHDADSNPADRVIFVKGDPDEVIRGAKTQPQSPWSEQNIQEWSQFSLVAIMQFVEKEEVIKKSATTTKEQLENENAAKDRTQAGDKNKLKTKIAKNAEGRWVLTTYSDKLSFTFKADSGNRLQMDKVTSGTSITPLQVVHWSTSEDGNVLSVLLRTQEAGVGKSLIAMYFQRDSTEQKIETTLEKYVYLAGPGKKVGWKLPADKSLEIKLCSSSVYKDIAQNSVNSWGQNLTGRLNLTFSQTIDFAPFSDLNQHCIYIVDTYLYEARDDAATYGVTVPIISVAAARFVDADVFMFRAEVAKKYTAAKQAGYTEEAATEYAYKNFPLAVTHELGHFLGLDHKFDKTPSVMSYDFLYSTPQSYDIEAIQELYPLRSLPAAKDEAVKPLAELSAEKKIEPTDLAK